PTPCSSRRTHRDGRLPLARIWLPTRRGTSATLDRDLRQTSRTRDRTLRPRSKRPAAPAGTHLPPTGYVGAGRGPTRRAEQGDPRLRAATAAAPGSERARSGSSETPTPGAAFRHREAPVGAR